MENINTVENEIMDVAAEAAPEVIEEACVAAKSGSGAAKYIALGAGSAILMEVAVWAGKKYVAPWFKAKKEAHKAKRAEKKNAKTVVVGDVIDVEESIGS